MILAGDAYRPGTSPARLTAFALIAAVHLALVTAIALAGGPKAVIEKTKPLLVQFVPPAPAPAALPVASVPLPKMRTPDIVLPTPPVIETIAVQREERPAPPVEAAPKIVATAEPPRPAPAAEPPRYDMAYLNNPQPVYPPLSRRLREEGRVVLRVLVNATGLVDEIEIVNRSGFARLDEAAREAVRRWKFAPARAGGQAVAGWALVPIAFNLQGQA